MQKPLRSYAVDAKLTPVTTASHTPAEMVSSPQDWLRVTEASKRLGLPNPRTLYRLTSQRKVPFRRLPGTSIVAFSPEDMKAIADMSLVPPLGTL